MTSPIASTLRWTAALTAATSLMAASALALDFVFPGPATTTASLSDALTSYALPTGPWGSGGLPTRIVEGTVDRTAWRIDAAGLSTLQLLAPLRDQLRAAGYTILWECETRACGGFDFRFATEVLPEPDMHVDLGDFRFLAAERGPDTLTILVSRSAETGFAQIIRVGPPAPAAPLVNPSPTTPPASASGPALSVPSVAEFASALETNGAVALDDLAFETGSSKLGAGDFPSLDALAAYLLEHPDRKVTLVGHTDAAGSLANNVALSKARAASVRDRLIDAFSIPPDQIGAEGVGFLAPRASNLTDEGRTRNRRVEVMLTSTK